jgi:tellurite resistance protein TerC
MLSLLLNEFAFWGIFAAIVSILFFIDLYVTDHRRGKITLKASIIWSGVWIFTALLFNLFIYLKLENGHQKGIEFLTGYLIEKSLSVDNLFVFLMIFNVMRTPAESQPHVLKWGIIGAIIFRVIFVLTGVGLLNLFHPIIYIFALVLLFAAYKLAFMSEHKIDPEKSKILRLISKYFNITPTYHEKKFFIKLDGKRFATSLFLTLVLIETSDIIFAVDSIPAIIAITNDTFIIISSNIFAILGLRALYFALAGIVDLFVFLKYGVAIILFYVGIKMLIAEFYKIPAEISLIIIISVLAASVILSLLKKKKSEG